MCSCRAFDLRLGTGPVSTGVVGAGGPLTLLPHAPPRPRVVDPWDTENGRDYGTSPRDKEGGLVGRQGPLEADDVTPAEDVVVRLSSLISARSNAGGGITAYPKSSHSKIAKSLQRPQKCDLDNCFQPLQYLGTGLVYNSNT